MRQDKTIAEISDNIREAVKMLDDDVSYVVSAGQMRNLANLLDKAAIRERAEAATKAATDAINLTEEKWRRQCSDVAKLRELAEFVAHIDDNGYTSHDVQQAIDKAKAALAAPARNCDVLTPEVLFNEFINDMPEEVEKITTEHERGLIFLAAKGVIETLFATYKPEEEVGGKK